MFLLVVSVCRALDVMHTEKMSLACRLANCCQWSSRPKILQRKWLKQSNLFTRRS
jgi:hypothetical protein